MMINNDGYKKELNNEIENLTKKLADAYRSNDQEQINKLQQKIKEETDNQLKRNIDELVKEDLQENQPTIIEDSEGKNYINREILLSKLGYLYNYKEKRKNYSTEEDFILGELKTIKDELLANEGIEIPYIPTVRAKYCIEEFDYYLKRNQANDCLMDIYEVIESDKNEIYSPINAEFKYSIYITKEEKTIILNMVNKLEAHLKASDNQPEEIKKLEFEKTNVVVRETYIDENGHERDREKTIEMPVFPKQESVDNDDIVKAICKQIEELPNETEFTLQQFMKDYNLEEKDKFGLCGSIFEYCKNNNIEIIEKYPDAVLGLPHNIPRIKKSNEQNSNQLSKEDFDNFLTALINKHQEIKFKDNNKSVSYTIEKDGDNYNIKLEKKINFNENINNLFNELIQYCNSITDISKYWPNSEQEYPDLKIMWEIYTKLGNESNKLNGALSYPEKWDELISKINDEFNVMLSNEEKSLVSRIDERLKEINPDYEPPEIDYSKIDNNEEHTVEELISIIDDKLEKNDTEDQMVSTIVNKIIELPTDSETSIAKLINYNPEINFVAPLTQGIIFNKVKDMCKDKKINLQSTYDGFGGIAFYYTFKKVDENLQLETYCYDFIPYEQIGPIKLNLNNESNERYQSVPGLIYDGINKVSTRPMSIDLPEVIKRNGKTYEVYIKYNETKIKLTCYFDKFINDLKQISDDIKFIEETDKFHFITAISEKLGMIVVAEKKDNQFLIHHIRYLGKDSFDSYLNNFELNI